MELATSNIINYLVKVATALLEDGGVGAEAVALARDLVQLARQPHLQLHGNSCCTYHATLYSFFSGFQEKGFKDPYQISVPDFQLTYLALFQGGELLVERGDGLLRLGQPLPYLWNN